MDIPSAEEALPDSKLSEAGEPLEDEVSAPAWDEIPGRATKVEL